MDPDGIGPSSSGSKPQNPLYSTENGTRQSQTTTSKSVHRTTKHRDSGEGVTLVTSITETGISRDRQIEELSASWEVP